MNATSLRLLTLFIGIISPIAASAADRDYGVWENEIAAFEKSDLAVPPPKGALLFTGSSTIRLWTTLASDLPVHQVINRGFGGSQIVDATHFAERMIFLYSPRMIFLRAGGNDIHQGKSAEQVFADFQQFVAKVRTQLPKTEIVFIALCPNISRAKDTAKATALNTMVSEYSQQTARVKYLDAAGISLDSEGRTLPDLFVEDMLHFNAAGYQLMAEKVREFLKANPPES